MSWVLRRAYDPVYGVCTALNCVAASCRGKAALSYLFPTRPCSCRGRSGSATYSRQKSGVCAEGPFSCLLTPKAGPQKALSQATYPALAPRAPRAERSTCPLYGETGPGPAEWKGVPESSSGVSSAGAVAQSAPRRPSRRPSRSPVWWGQPCGRPGKTVTPARTTTAV